MNPYGVSAYPATLPLDADAGAEDLAWQDDALCMQVDGDVFFPDKGQPSAPAKRVCQDCPVKAECLEYALENDIHHGVWGGESEMDRRRIRRQRNRRLPA